jgi:hypothetical protein
MKTVYIERNKLFKNFQMILLNNILEVDENFLVDNIEIFETECDICKGEGEINDKKCDECGGDGSFQNEVYQFYLIDIDDLDRERLESYGVEVGYSQKLEKYILPIYDFGTSWSAFSYSKEVDDDYQLENDETLKRSTVY